MAGVASVDDAMRFLSLLSRPGDVFELRGLVRVHGQQHVTSGYFDDFAELAKVAVARSGLDAGVYVTINPTLPALLSRGPKNRVRRAGNGDTTSDRDVRIRRSILIDVDPVRPAGISSTDAEHDGALELVRRVAADLSDLGWPMPILADSGNGGHLIYAVDLPVDDGGLVKRVLERLSKRYTTPELKIDEKVFNPARISKIYGTLTKKGEDTEERPHRVSRILHAPDALDTVTRDQLEAFAPATTRAQTSNGPTTQSHAPQFDLDEWLARYLPDAIAMSWSEGRKWLLQVCPFNGEHDRREAYITEKHGGSIAAGCQHESCFKTWRELRVHFEPHAYDRANGNGNGHQRVSHREDPPEVIYQDDRYREEIDAVADRDREPATPPTAPEAAATTKAKWWRGPELVDEIMRFANEPWVGLKLLDEEIVRVRAGGIAVVMGGSGSGKSSLVSGLLIDHARNVGPAIALSIELPADELAGRIVGMQCEASWEEALRGQVKREFMTQALSLPRLYVIDRDNATLECLEQAIDAARKEYPSEPILSAVDYAQIVTSSERETRQQVADVFRRIDRVTRGKRVVAIAVSQMSRNAAKQARDGERIGADSADGGAESAAIERFATVTLSIGQANQTREDGSQAVELSIGKGRMTGGDRVLPMTYWGRIGRWRVAGPPKVAADVREARKTETDAKKQKQAELALVALANQATEPQTQEQLTDQLPGNAGIKRSAIKCLLARGELVQVQQKSPRAKAWKVWTPDRAIDAGVQLVRDMEDQRG